MTPLPARVRIAFTAAVFASCTQVEQLPAGTHTWGTYQLCLERISDTCHEPGEACDTPAVDDTRSALVGVVPESGLLYWTRGNATAGEGQQVGRRFEASWTQDLPSVCDCAARVKETIRGELLESRPAACSAVGSDAGCTAGDGGLPDFADAADGGLPLDTTFPGLQGVLVDEVTSIDVEGKACPCLPCRVEYRITGRQ